MSSRTPARQRKGKARRGKNGSAKRQSPRTGIGMGREKQGNTYVSATDDAFFVGLTGGVGSISVLTSNVASTLTPNTALLNPTPIGGRHSSIADMFLKYRIRAGRIRYVPTESTSGVLQIAVTTAAPAYGEIGLVMGLSKDVNLAPASYTAAVQWGGKAFRSSEHASIVIPPSPWLYITPIDNTSAEARFTYAGLFFIYPNTAGLAAGATYGNIYYDLEIEYSFPQNAGLALGSLATDSSSSESKIASTDRVSNKTHCVSRQRNGGDVPFYPGSKSTVFATPKFDQLVSHPVRLHQDATTSSSMAKLLCSDEDSFVNVSDSKEQMLSPSPALQSANSAVDPLLGQAIPAQVGSGARQFPPAIDILRYLTQLGFPAS